MSSDCIFCRIVVHEAEASVVHEDAATMVFMDLRQFHAGHTVVVPKRHIVDIFELDDATGAAVMATVARVARAVRGALSPDGINVWQSNGRGAGQEVFHLHFHVLPRSEGDGLLQVYPSRPDYPERAELDEQAERIRSYLEG